LSLLRVDTVDVSVVEQSFARTAGNSVGKICSDQEIAGESINSSQPADSVASWPVLCTGSSFDGHRNAMEHKL
jgi:hypothetical protein